MKRCLKDIKACPISSHFILTDPFVVQIIGIKPYKNISIFYLSDSFQYIPAVIAKKTKDITKFQLIEFNKIYIHATPHNDKLLVLEDIKIVSSSTECMGCPLPIYCDESLSSFKLQSPKNTSGGQFFIGKVVFIGSELRFMDLVLKITLEDKSHKKINGAMSAKTYFTLTKKIKTGKVYLITNISFEKRPGTEEIYIKLNDNTEFKETDDNFVEMLDFQPTDLEEIERTNSDSKFFSCDVRAVIVNVGQIVILKSGSLSRIVTLADHTNRTIQLKLYDCYTLPISKSDEGKVIVIKSAPIIVKAANRYISIGVSYQYYNHFIKVLENDHPISRELFEWYQKSRQNVGNFNHLSNKRMVKLGQIQKERLGMEKDAFFVVDAKLKKIAVSGTFYEQNNKKFGVESKFTITESRSDSFILFCATCSDVYCRGYNKKLRDFHSNETGESVANYCYECKSVVKKPRYVFLFDALFSDGPDEEWFRVMSFFNNVGEMILGRSPEKWKEETEGLSKGEKEELIEPSLMRYRLDVKAMKERPNERFKQNKLKPYPILIVEKICPLFDD